MRKALAALSFLLIVGCSDTLAPIPGAPLSGSYLPPAITIALFYDYGDVLAYSGTFQDANHLRGTLANAQGRGSPLTFTRR